IKQRAAGRRYQLTLRGRRADIFPFTMGSAIGLIGNRGNVVDPSGLRRLIETHLPYARLEDAQIPLHIMATNQQGMAVRLSNGPAVEAILASTALPGVFPHVHIGGDALMDGAIAANTPVRLAALQQTWVHHESSYCQRVTPAL